MIEIHRFLFFETDLTQPLPPIPAARIPLEIHPLRAEEVETLAPAFRVAGLALQEVGRRLARGDVCIIALSGSHLVHFQWAAFSPVRIGGKGESLGLTLHLRAGEAYSYDAVTLVPWRGRGIHPVVSEYLAQYERGRGYTRHILYVNARNRASRKTIARLRRAHTKTVWAFRLLEGRWQVLLGATCAGSPSLTL